MASPGKITVTGEIEPHMEEAGYQYLQPSPELLKPLTPEQLAHLRRMASRNSINAARARASMARLPVGGNEAGFAATAQYNTIHRRPDMTPFELAALEALRDPVTGVPPRDVVGTFESFNVSY